MNLSQNIISADIRAKYDEAAKKLLASKQILARILKQCVGEFRDYSIPEIIDSINHDMEISIVPVNPGFTNNVISLSNENSIAGEGTVFFDLLFRATARRPKVIHVWINIEPQNRYDPGYDSISRGIFYCARELSAQAETVFSLARQEYDRLEKVYSIWIFMNASKKDSDTITSCRMTQKRIHGNFQGKARYDLLETTAICLTSKPEESENDLIRILSTLFTTELNAEKKISLLKQYGVQVSDDYGKEIEHMCNLSEGVWDDGMKEGARLSSIQTAKNLLKTNLMSDQEISDMVSNHVTPEEVEMLRHGKTLN